MLQDQMENIYRNMSPDKIPWNMDSPPDILREIVELGKVQPCRVVDLGCGCGNYTMYLAEKGFTATGIDFSRTIIQIAKKAAAVKGIDCTFIVSDVLKDMSEVQDTFELAFEWELLHHIFPEDREKYVQNVHRLLIPRGLYVSVCFSEDSPQFGGKDKYRKTPLGTLLYFSSEDEIRSLVEPLFDILELKTVEVQGKMAPHKAVYAFLRKR